MRSLPHGFPSGTEPLLHDLILELHVLGMGRVLGSHIEIANLMGIKWFTVNDHIKSIYKKLNVSSRAEAAVLASKQGLV